MGISRSKCTFLLFVVLMCLFSMLLQNVYAVEGRLTLRDCIEVGLTYNIDVVLARMDYEEAKAILERAELVGDKELIESSLDAFKKAEERLNSVMKSVAENIEQKFYNLCRAEDALQNDLKALKRSEISLEADEIRFEAGTIALLDIEASRSDFQNRKETYENSLIDLKTQYMEFNRLLGLELDTVIELQGEFDFSIIKVDFDEAYEMALANRSDIRDTLKQIEEAETLVRNLDNPYSARIELEKALLDVERKKLLFKQKCETVFFEVRQACINLERAEKRISRAESNLEIAIRRNEVTKIRYEAGLLSTQQFLTAQSDLSTAENAVIQAKWDYHNAKLNYLRAIGMSDLETLLEEMGMKELVEGGSENNA